MPEVVPMFKLDPGQAKPRTGLKRSGIKRSTKRIRPRSKSYRDIPKKVRAEVQERSGGYCEAVDLAHECVGFALPMHHILPRSSGGKHVASNLLHCCTAGHFEIHARPAISEPLGYLERTSA